MSTLICEDRQTGRIEKFDLDSQAARTEIILAAKENNIPVAEVMGRDPRYRPWLSYHASGTRILEVTT